MAVVIAIDIFGAHFQLMSLAQRTEPVSLEGVFRKTLTLSLQTTCVIEGCIHHVRISVLLICVLARQGEHVRECESLALSTRLVLVVQSSVPRGMTVARHPVVIVITVDRQSC